MGAWGASIDLSETFTAKPDADATRGQVFHVARNQRGGSMWTPVARYFAWRPDVGPEDYRPHWRLDCFARDHELAPDPEWLGNALADTLVHQNVISEPLWTSWHRSQELGGEARGVVFDLD